MEDPNEYEGLSKKEIMKLEKKNRRAKQLEDRKGTESEYEAFEVEKKKGKGNQKQSKAKQRQDEVQNRGKKGKQQEVEDAFQVRRSKPQPALTAFKIYCSEHPGVKKDKLFEDWKEVPASTKAEYKVKADTDKERYTTEMEAYNKQQEDNPELFQKGGTKSKEL